MTNKRLQLCVALNGPPGIGKDTIAAHLNKVLSFGAVDAVADTIKRQAEEFTGIRKFTQLATERETKDTVLPVWGLTPRQIVHQFSDKMQQEHGRDVFMREMLAKHKDAKTFLMTDLGLKPEMPMLEASAERVLVIQLMHQDFGFQNDIREFIFPKDKANLIQLTTTRGDIDGDVQRILHALRERLS